MKKILMIIGAGILQAPAIRTAREMGLLTLVTDYNGDAYGMKLADFPVVMSTRDVDGTVRVAKEFSRRRRIDGVITVGTDASLTVAAVQHALDLPGNRLDVAEATTHKLKMRSRLREHGVPQPEFFSCWRYDDALDASRALGFPFVIKPVDNMGARGVMRVDRAEAVRFAYERAKNASPRGEVVCEGYMDGPELSIDALVWNGEIRITGVADRIIEFPPYFVETGHVMPTSLPPESVREGIEVFKRGIRALGIEIGAAKGDIKLTPRGAMVGEIASRLSGGFMSAYTYPYSSGVDLIRAAINIAMGNPPGDITEKHRRVSVERAIIPGSGVVRAIEGIEEAMSIKGVKNVFVTASVGDVVHIPTSNVEKCGNVIAVADTRGEALEAANLAVKTVRIVLGSGEDLNEGLIRKNALQKLAGVCSVCRVCDGRECAGRMPGIGSRGEGAGFKRNLGALERYTILPDAFKTLDNVSTGSELFGVPLDLPVLPAPISNTARNFKGLFAEEELARAILKGARKAGSVGCVAEREYAGGGAAPTDGNGAWGRGGPLAYVFDALSDVFGYGVPFFDPFRGEATALGNIEKAFERGARTVGLSLDLKDGRGAAFFGAKALASIVKRSPVPIIVKGVLTRENALLAAGAGVKGIVLSNRGGRILEHLPSGIEVLPSVRESLGGEFLLAVDGGVRSGEDVFKAIALGADLVLIGRPVIVALAGGGEEGVSFYLDKIRIELREAMLVAGAKTVKEIGAGMISNAPPP